MRVCISLRCSERPPSSRDECGEEYAPVSIKEKFDPQICVPSLSQRETLRLIETTVEKSDDMQRIVDHFVPPLVDYVLTDYQSNHPDTRDPEVSFVVMFLLLVWCSREICLAESTLALSFATTILTTKVTIYYS